MENLVCGRFSVLLRSSVSCMMPPQKIKGHHYNMARCTIQQQSVAVLSMMKICNPPNWLVVRSCSNPIHFDPLRTVMKIGILGAGNVGGALGRIWASKGHDITFGVPDPMGDRVRAAVAALQGKGRAGTNSEAVKSAEAVVLTVPWPAAEDAIHAAGGLNTKVLIDCTNPVRPGLKGLVVGLTTSAAEQVAGWAQGAKVVKAFNT